MTTTVADTAIIERILAGEKQLFEVLIRRYTQRLYRIGMSVLANEAETANAIQTTYINAYQHLSDFNYRSMFSTWLIHIMLNQSVEQKRKAPYRLSAKNEPYNFIDMKTPANELANKELSNMLERAIGELPEKYRLVFMLREIEEMSVRDTAAALSIEEVNVKARLNRAKTMLRENLQSYMKDHLYSFHYSRCDRVVKHVMTYLGIA
ncbi:MAG: sigma-70 family RNA polymerase sigma factor [Chitinophaga sp.]|uniref:sigma-70 family RNA polymerase sigma factor n=1 Tax=Chitinophaga sp. TaxID=1869181 RepID=UPI001B16F467|nr:sigma-70 family RNA polymerase sigma factor [Chitinophaga sp.]MBO9729592.1 sigma-70 family RNA polymerase sigma factor [Chitinophaga sp.]